MIKNSLHEFTDRALDSGVIGSSDIALLCRDVLHDGLASREEADVLIALDRVIARKHAAFEDVLVRLIVDFAVWVSRPTGVIEREAAEWLVASLCAGSGPTPAGVRAAFEIVRESERVDEALVAFVMRARAGAVTPTARGQARLPVHAA